MTKPMLSRAFLLSCLLVLGLALSSCVPGSDDDDVDDDLDDDARRHAPIVVQLS
jgi:hypothetical protein